MEITIPLSKTDQLQEGHIVLASRTESEKCPVAWTEKYLTLTALQRNPNSYLISRLAHTKRGHNAIGRRSLSYSRIRENFLELLAPYGPQVGGYGITVCNPFGQAALPPPPTTPLAID